MNGRDKQRSAIAPQLAGILPVFGRIDKGSQVNAVARGQRLQQVERADLVALVGRIRDPVDEVKKVLHPRWRARKGPTVRLTHSGSLRHSAMKRWYFGLVGLMSGTARAFTR